MTHTDGTPNPLATARAPGKVILIGEHAVVHGRPAIAVPVFAVEARVVVWPTNGDLAIRSRNAADGSEQRTVVREAPDDDPLATAVRGALRQAGAVEAPGWEIEVVSSIPVARGLGSSAAVAVALARAVGRACGTEFDDATVSRLAYEAERKAHGTPSGIDNTTIAYEHAVHFVDGEATRLTVRSSFQLVIGSAGARMPTHELVARIREARARRPGVFDDWFDQIGRLADDTVVALATGETVRVGWLMNTNHLVLQAMRLSTPRLDGLVAAARAAGALGAKLTGAGGGGAMVALAEASTAARVASALRDAGSEEVIVSEVPASGSRE
jgi:mevalonate kinase